MSCIKTGCYVYVAPYNEYVYCDAFSTSNNTLYLRIVWRTREYPDVEPFIRVFDFEDWFDRDKRGTSTLISTTWVYAKNEN